MVVSLGEHCVEQCWVYRVLDLLQRSIWSLYNNNKSCARILGAVSNTKSMGDGLCPVPNIHGKGLEAKLG